MLGFKNTFKCNMYMCISLVLSLPQVFLTVDNGQFKRYASIFSTIFSCLFFSKKRKLGPGTYNHTDFLQLMERRPHSIRGICDTGAVRFKDRMRV